jgi:hypothetical protein
MPTSRTGNSEAFIETAEAAGADEDEKGWKGPSKGRGEAQEIKKPCA